ncbi:MAG: sterol desaturase family protein [Proteobacteria bacterium]|jgi:sterol desaturase/sphingolipid hydroxylase (fatty acid hydroxylase superfamily)|nr:sterol desaturase family protein [Pseudomonadota bacterium]
MPIIDVLFAHPSSIQVGLYACLISLLWLCECLRMPQTLGSKWRHTSLNSLFILSALPIQLMMMVPCLYLARWTAEHDFGLVYLLPDPERPLFKFALMFVVLDLLDYVYHRTAHRVGFMWRFHSVHHSDLAVDVTTTVREHPGETVMRNCFLIFYVLLCGASIEVLVLRQTAQTVANLCSHTALRLPDRAARVVAWLFITPNLHHAHHHFMLPTTNRNFGDVFSLWDRLFGTLVHRKREDTVFGLNGRMDGALDARLRAKAAELWNALLRRPAADQVKAALLP